MLIMSRSRAVSVPQPRRTNHGRNYMVDRTLHRLSSTVPTRTTLSSFSVTFLTGPSAAMKTQGGRSIPTRCKSAKYRRRARVMRDFVIIQATKVFRYLQKGLVLQSEGYGSDGWKRKLTSPALRPPMPRSATFLFPANFHAKRSRRDDSTVCSDLQDTRFRFKH